MYGKRTEFALAAMSRLAEEYPDGVRLTAAGIAAGRHLPAAAVARALTALARAGLVIGSPGPGGGYALARSPASITVHDVYRVFEDERAWLDLGRGLDNNGTGPIDAKLAAVREAMAELLHRTTLDAFGSARTALSPSSDAPEPRSAVPRASYRAPLAGRSRRG